MGPEHYLNQEFRQINLPTVSIKILQLLLRDIPYQEVATECDLLIIHHCEEVRIGDFRCLICFDKNSNNPRFVSRYIHHGMWGEKQCITFSQTLRVPQRVVPVPCKERFSEDQEVAKNCVRVLLFHELITLWIGPWVCNKVAYFCRKKQIGRIGQNVEELVLRYTRAISHFYETWYAVHVFDMFQVDWYLANAQEVRRRDASRVCVH